MMRVFGPECFDVSEINGDGWVVGHNMIAYMGTEQCQMSQTAVHWLYSHKQTEILVALSARSVWHGIQQAVRAFLFEEHNNQIIIKLLLANEQRGSVEYESHARAMGHWLALRASQRDLIPVAMQAAQLLQVDGYDPIPGAGEFVKRDINRMLPMVYTTWAKMSSNILGNAKGIIEAELEVMLGELSLDLDELAQCIQAAQQEPTTQARDTPNKCVACKDDYTVIGRGLVQPSRIAFSECRASQHRHNCVCSSYLYARGVTKARAKATSGDTDEADIEEEIYRESEVGMDLLCAEYDKLGIDDSALGDPFYDAAAMLYRSHGRRWIGEYDYDEVLCAACFLKREGYIGEDGPCGFSRFTPAPKTYVSACPPDTFDATYSS